MSDETIRTTFTYLIAILVIAGGGALLVIPSQVPSEQLLPFMTGIIGAVIAYVFQDRASARQAANQPTVTTSSGPPPTVTVSPPTDGPQG